RLRPLMQRAPGELLRAALVAGTLILDEELAVRSATPGSVEEIFVTDALEALAQREIACRGLHPAVPVAGRTVLLVDNGIRTGGAQGARGCAVRKVWAGPGGAAVAVASAAGGLVVQKLADECVCLAWPGPFGNVAMFYKRFAVPSEQQVRDLLRDAR